MINYFKLQYTIFNRYLIDWIKYPFLIIFIFPFVFIWGYNFCIDKLPYGNYFFLLFLVQFLFLFNGKKRQEFLKINLKKKQYRLVRLYENLIVALPFFIIEIVNNNFKILGLIFIIAFSMSLVAVNIRYSFVLPTPFKHSFEFIYVFRKYFLLFLGCIVLTIIGVNVGNFNLTLFSLYIPFSIITLSNRQIESIYFIWLYSTSSKKFTKQKIIFLILNTLGIVTPFYIIALYGFPEKYHYTIASLTAGLVMVITGFIVKYANFTSIFVLEIVLAFVVLSSLGSLFNPLLFIAILLIITASFKKYSSFIKSYLKC